MVNILKNASCLIRTRELHVGFPERFSHRPDEIPADVESHFANLISEAMNDPTYISEESGFLRRVVIAESGYLILGIAGRLENFLEDPDGSFNSFCDVAGRKVYGFVGFIWDTNGKIGPFPQFFPAMRSFQSLMEEQILTHWADSSNSRWAEQITKGGHSVPYHCTVEFDEDSTTFASEILPVLNLSEPKKIKKFPLQIGEKLVYTAVLAAVNRVSKSEPSSKAIPFSFCTDLHTSYGNHSFFMNTSSPEVSDPNGEWEEDELKESSHFQDPAKITEKLEDGFSGFSEMDSSNRQDLELLLSLGIYSDKFDEQRICENFWRTVHQLTQKLPDWEISRNNNLGFKRKAMNFLSGFVFFSYVVTAPNLTIKQVYDVLDMAKSYTLKREAPRKNSVEIVLKLSFFPEESWNAEEKKTKKIKRKKISEQLEQEMPDGASLSDFISTMSQSSSVSKSPSQLFGQPFPHTRASSPEKKPEKKDPFDF